MARVLIGLIALLAVTGCTNAAGTVPSKTPESAIPYACLGLEEPDCRSVLDAASAELGPDDVVVYAEIGPFGCPADVGCANTLAARPSGQVVFERSTGEPITFSVNAGVDGTITTGPGEWFTVAVPPSSVAGNLAGPIPVSLGHCGLMSGVDVDGSWSDPVGFVDVDHADSINAANGTFTPSDPNHATYATAGGFTVNLVRRVGEKHLPLCM
jgi:hypothetical protein